MKLHLSICIFLVLAFVGCSHGQKSHEDAGALSLDELYRKGQRAFHKSEYGNSLRYFQSYIKAAEPGKYRKPRLIWVIDQVGYIYLRVQMKPEEAIRFFKNIENDERLSAAQADTITEWLGAAEEWKNEKHRPQTIQGANRLYTFGKKYFDRGVMKIDFPMDKSGNADFAIAGSYLRPFIIRFNNDKRIGDALLMMGTIKTNLRTDKGYWSENYFLKEAIRRFPGTKLAQKAWKKLDGEIRIGYTGSSGKHVPRSVENLLSEYKKLAYRK